MNAEDINWILDKEESGTYWFGGSLGTTKGYRMKDKPPPEQRKFLKDIITKQFKRGTE